MILLSTSLIPLKVYVKLESYDLFSRLDGGVVWYELELDKF